MQCSLNGIVNQGDHCIHQDQHLFVHRLRSGQELGAMPLMNFLLNWSLPQDEDTKFAEIIYLSIYLYEVSVFCEFGMSWRFFPVYRRTSALDSLGDLTANMITLLDLSRLCFAAAVCSCACLAWVRNQAVHRIQDVAIGLQEEPRLILDGGIWCEKSIL
jgi:hypothetical protein